jgi:hypothetical protein
LLAEGTKGACPANQACNAAGACEEANGQTCDPTKSGTDCASGFCSGGDDFCCAQACTGPCAKCAGGTTCGLLAEGSQGACPANQACNAAGACENAVGQSCNPVNNGTDCDTGFCSGGDDFCCAVSCTGPCAKCAGGMTCGLLPAGSVGACGVGLACSAAGTCVLVLSGAGTAASPYTTTPPLTKCSTYLTAFPAAGDGVYTINPGTGVENVYCDMVHGGITYASFGFGQYTATYAGWTLVGAADFTGTTEFDAAFAYLYDRNGGLINLQPGFVSNNCCIANANAANWFGIDGAQVAFPWMNGAGSCNPPGGYTAAIIQLEDAFAATEIPPSITAAQAGTVNVFTTCGNSGNPAIFVQKL